MIISYFLNIFPKPILVYQFTFFSFTSFFLVQNNIESCGLTRFSKNRINNFAIFIFQNELKDVEEKFRKAMVANASMDNEKSALTYQVELLKDQLEECEEQSALVTKELREKSRDYELLKRSHQETQRAVQLLQVFMQNCIKKKKKKLFKSILKVGDLEKKS